MNAINVRSEIGPLKKVLLHRPGNELLNLTPDTLTRLLFDDIPFLPDAQKEHDEFANILKTNSFLSLKLFKYSNTRFLYFGVLIPASSINCLKNLSSILPLICNTSAIKSSK